MAPDDCTGCPVKGTPAHHINAPGAPPIVMIGNTGDPATPHSRTPAVAEQLGSGVLLTGQPLQSPAGGAAPQAVSVTTHRSPALRRPRPPRPYRASGCLNAS